MNLSIPQAPRLPPSMTGAYPPEQIK